MHTTAPLIGSARPVSEKCAGERATHPRAARCTTTTASARMLAARMACTRFRAMRLCGRSQQQDSQQGEPTEHWRRGCEGGGAWFGIGRHAIGADDNR